MLPTEYTEHTELSRSSAVNCLRVFHRGDAQLHAAIPAEGGAEKARGGAVDPEASAR